MGDGLACGRQLDGVVASLDALPKVAAAADGRREIYLDGVRAVMIGRPILWGAGGLRRGGRL